MDPDNLEEILEIIKRAGSPTWHHFGAAPARHYITGHSTQQLGSFFFLMHARKDICFARPVIISVGSEVRRM